MKGTTEALIITTVRITALYHYLMSSLSSLSLFIEGKGSIPTKPTVQAHYLQPQCTPHLVPSPNFFSLGMCSAETGEEPVTYLRTACTPNLDLPRQLLKWEACLLPSCIYSK